MSSFSINFDLATPEGLANLNTFLASRSYIVGFAPTASDVVVFNAIGSAPDKNTYPNVFRYYTHIASFGNKTAKFKNALSAIVGGTAAPAAPAASGAGSAGAGSKPAPADDSDSDSDGDDLFGGSDSDDGAVVKKPVAAAPAKKKKKKKIERTQLTFYVNAVEYPCDMEALEASVRTVQMDGLSWGEAFDVKDIGYGIQKLHVQCIIVNDLLGTDDVTAAVEALDTVSSTDAGTMNRLG